MQFQIILTPIVLFLCFGKGIRLKEKKLPEEGGRILFKAKRRNHYYY
jgi:hypothetical protein